MAHETALQRACIPRLHCPDPLDERRRLREHRPAPVLGPGASPSTVNLMYADNHAVLGCDRQAVDVHRPRAADFLHHPHRPVHEETGVLQEGEFLGCYIQGKKASVSASNKRVWRIVKAFDTSSRVPARLARRSVIC